MKVYNVAILGTGFGGICTALRLREEGETDFLMLEKAASVGGTWRDNTYPGAACDVKSHLYWPSFAEKPDWTKEQRRRWNKSKTTKRSKSSEGLAMGKTAAASRTSQGMKASKPS